MTLISNRLASAQAIVALLQGIQNPNTSQALYQFCKLGALFDPSAYTTWAEVTHFQGKGGPAGSGGNMIGWRVEEDVTFQITSGVGPYETDSSAAQTNMLTVQDVLLPALRQHFLLPNAQSQTIPVQGVYKILVEQVDRSQPVKFPNGHVYLLWHCFITVSQQYNLQLQNP